MRFLLNGVVCQETIGVQIEGTIKQHDFFPADGDGYAQSISHRDNNFGILYQPAPVKMFFGFYTKKPPRQFVGILRNIDKNWVMEAFGRESVELLIPLVRELMRILKTEITLTLTDPHPKDEYFGEARH